MVLHIYIILRKIIVLSFKKKKKKDPKCQNLILGSGKMDGY